MIGPTAEREHWLARNILPHERGLRAQLTRWRLPDDLDADDLVQECYGRLAALDSVDHIRNPRAYLYTTARTIILAHIRHAQVVSIRAVDNLESYGVGTDDPSPEEQVSDREQLHLLALAIAALPEPGRQAFKLRMIDELPYREVGERLGLTENAVQKSVAKSLRMLADRLGRGGNRDAGASKGRTQSREPNSDDSREERRD